jgi:hypothetical protein
MHRSPRSIPVRPASVRIDRPALQKDQHAMKISKVEAFAIKLKRDTLTGLALRYFCSMTA